MQHINVQTINVSTAALREARISKRAILINQGNNAIFTTFAISTM